MAVIKFQIPDAELNIIERYFDGVSHALAKRFVGGSSPDEENLTFLLCELLDEGTTGLHLLDYPLTKAKEDLAQEDGGITLDVSFQTHPHSKYIEHHFSGADLGVVFVVDHSYFGRSEAAILIQAKRLFSSSKDRFVLNSTFKHFDAGQRDFLKEVAQRFEVENSIFYLWYCPESSAFSDDDAKLLRSLEAMGGRLPYGIYPELDWLLHRGIGYDVLRRRTPAHKDAEHSERAWRHGQPAARVSSLHAVDKLTDNGRAPALISMYNGRNSRHRRWWTDFVFEPLSALFMGGLTRPSAIGDPSGPWLRLARGEQVAMPPSNAQSHSEGTVSDLPERMPTPRHSLTITIRSSLTWPENIPRPG